jgi:hypothetical protein
MQFLMLFLSLVMHFLSYGAFSLTAVLWGLRVLWEGVERELQ